MPVFFRLCPADQHTCSHRDCLMPGYDESTCPKVTPTTNTDPAPGTCTRWCSECCTHRTMPCGCNSCPIADAGGAGDDYSCWTFRTTERSFQWINPDERT